MEGRLILMLVAFKILSHCYSQHFWVAAQEPPKAAVFTYKNNGLTVEKVEFIEKEKYKLNEAVLVLECNASYPIEWIGHYTKGTGSQNRVLAYNSYELAETRRRTLNFEDPNSYEYTAILEAHCCRTIFSDECTPTHFTCKATQTEDRVLQSHVYMRIYDGTLFSLELTPEYKSEYLDTTRAFDGKSDCRNGSFTASLSQNRNLGCLSCNGHELTATINVCYAATECKNNAARLLEATQCLQRSIAKSDTCLESVYDLDRYYLGDNVHNPLVVHCFRRDNHGFPVPVLFQIYFFGVFRGDLRNDLAPVPPLYFSWSEVNPTQMLHIHPIGKEKMLVGEDVTMKCEYSRFYFSHGSWFAIRHPDGRIEYIRALEKKPCDRQRFSYADVQETEKERLVDCDWNVPEKRRSTFTATLRRKLETAGKYELFCIGPVWNTTDWVNVSLPITTLPSVGKPTVEISVSSDGGQGLGNAAKESLPEIRIPNWNASFLLKCKATYPIEWIFRYNEASLQRGGKMNEPVVLAETRRHVLIASFNDPTSYSYTAWVQLEYTGKLTSISKFICKSALQNDTQLQTHVYMTSNGNSTTLQVDDFGAKLSLNTTSEQPLPHQEGAKGCTARLQYAQPEPNHICVSCSELYYDLQFRSYRTPIECNSLFARNGQHASGKRKSWLAIVQSNVGFHPGARCNSWQDLKLKNYHPKYVQCKGPEDGQAVAGLLFFGVNKNIPELDSNQEVGDEEIKRVQREIPVYVNWWDVDGSKIVYLHPLKSHLLPNESVEVTCEYSRFYFSLGSWFGMKRPNGNFQYFPGVDIRACDTGTERAKAKLGTASCNPSKEAERRGTFNATLTLKFEESGTYQIFCLGPVWNTTEWAKSSRFIFVDKWEPPKVVSVLPRGNKTLAIDQEGSYLECTFKGHPKPNIRWTTPPGILTENYTRESSNILYFMEAISYSHFRTYRCYAEALNQSDFGEYTAIPEKETVSGASITAIVVACLLLLLGVTGVIAKMRQTIAEQQKALRLLTDTEVKEFLEGSPVEANADRSEYISSIAAIEALPYDRKYEIPLDRLVIDYTSRLGCGEYGIILKGKLRPQKTANYVNLAVQFRAYENAAMLMEGDEGSERPIQELEIAVKVCKQNLGIEPFKALLSEVKVMAYLGQSENILSLIGASTENIRNREIYIAEELCHNGSLDIFVKKHKKKYFNMVRRGRYRDDLEPRAPTSAGELSDSDLQSPFSTTELIRWTRNIAAGVEYIHDKRVIHGDLALRNVLLTKNFVAKIGDFGLSRRLGEVSIYTKTTECPLPWRSMAIESLLHLQFSAKSDMWSVGVTLWELFTLGALPYHGLSHNSDFIKELENGTLRLPTPHLAPFTICDFLLMCWESVPEDRPSPVDIMAICDALISTP